MATTDPKGPTPKPTQQTPLVLPPDVARSMKLQGYDPAAFNKDIADMQAAGKTDEAYRNFGLIVDRHRIGTGSNAFGQISKAVIDASPYQKVRTSQGANESGDAWSDFGKSFYNGAVVRLGQGLQFLGSAIPQALDPANKDWLRTWQDTNAQWYQDNKLFVTPQAEAGIFGKDGDINWRGVAGTMGNTLGMMATTFLPLVGQVGRTGQATSLLGRLASSTAAQSGAIGFMQMLPMYTEEARKAGYSPTQAMMASIPLAATQGMLEHFGMSVFTKALGIGTKEASTAMRLIRQETAKDAFKQLTGKELTMDAFQDVTEAVGKGFLERMRSPETLRKILSNAGKGAAEEGGEEFLQTWADYLIKGQFDAVYGNSKLGDGKGFDMSWQDAAKEAAVGTFLGGMIGGTMGGMFGSTPSTFQQQTLFSKVDDDVKFMIGKGGNLLGPDGEVSEAAKQNLSSYKLLGRAFASKQIDEPTYRDSMAKLDSMAKVSEQLARTGVSSPVARYALYDLNNRQMDFGQRYTDEIEQPLSRLGEITTQLESGQYIPKQGLSVPERAEANMLIAQNLPQRAQIGQQISAKIDNYVNQIVNPDSREESLRRYAADIDADMRKFEQSGRPAQTRFAENELTDIISTMETPRGRFVLRRSPDPDHPREVLQVNTSVQGSRPDIAEDRDPVIDRFRGFQLPTAGKPVVSFSALDEETQGQILDAFDQNPDLVKPYGAWRTDLQNQYSDDMLAGLNKARELVSTEADRLAQEPVVSDWEKADLARKQAWVQENFQQLAENPLEGRYNIDDYIVDQHSDWLDENGIDPAQLASLPDDYKQGIYDALKDNDTDTATALLMAAVPLNETLNPNDTESSPSALLAAFRAAETSTQRRKIIEQLTGALAGREKIVRAVENYLGQSPDPTVEQRFAKQLGEYAAYQQQLADAIEQVLAEQPSDKDGASAGDGKKKTGTANRSRSTSRTADGTTEPGSVNRPARPKAYDPVMRTPQSVREAVLQYFSGRGRLRTDDVKQYGDPNWMKGANGGNPLISYITSDNSKAESLDNLARRLSEGFPESVDEQGVMRLIIDTLASLPANPPKAQLINMQQEAIEQADEQLDEVPTYTPLQALAPLFEAMDQAGISSTEQEAFVKKLEDDYITAEGLDWEGVYNAMGASDFVLGTKFLKNPDLKAFVQNQYLNQVAQSVELTPEEEHAAALLTPEEVAEIMEGRKLSDEVFAETVQNFALTENQVNELNTIFAGPTPVNQQPDESDIPILYPDRSAQSDSGTAVGNEETQAGRPSGQEKPAQPQEVAGDADVKGRKQVVNLLAKLREAKTPIDKLNIINRINQNIRISPNAITPSEENIVDTEYNDAFRQGYEIVDLYEGRFDLSGSTGTVKELVDNTTIPSDSPYSIVTKVISPQINKEGVLVQAAEVEVALFDSKQASDDFLNSKQDPASQPNRTTPNALRSEQEVDDSIQIENKPANPIRVDKRLTKQDEKELTAYTFEDGTTLADYTPTHIEIFFDYAIGVDLANEDIGGFQHTLTIGNTVLVLKNHPADPVPVLSVGLAWAQQNNNSADVKKALNRIALIANQSGRVVVKNPESTGKRLDPPYLLVDPSQAASYEPAPEFDKLAKIKPELAATEPSATPPTNADPNRIAIEQAVKRATDEVQKRVDTLAAKIKQKETKVADLKRQVKKRITTAPLDFGSNQSTSVEAYRKGVGNFIADVRKTLTDKFIPFKNYQGQFFSTDPNDNAIYERGQKGDYEVRDSKKISEGDQAEVRQGRDLYATKENIINYLGNPNSAFNQAVASNYTGVVAAIKETIQEEFKKFGSAKYKQYRGLLAIVTNSDIAMGAQTLTPEMLDEFAANIPKSKSTPAQMDLSDGQITGLEAEQAAKSKIAEAEAQLSALKEELTNEQSSMKRVAEVARQNAVNQQKLFAPPVQNQNPTPVDNRTPDQVRRDELLAKKAELAKKLSDSMRGTLNSGINPETLRIGLEYFAVSVELGVIKFKDFVREFIADTGSTIGEKELSTLKAVYDGSRSQVSDAIFDQMDDARSIRNLTIADIAPDEVSTSDPQPLQANERSPSTSAQSDSPRAGTTNPDGPNPVQPANPASPQRVDEPADRPAQSPAGRPGSQRVPEPIAPLFGESGNQRVSGTERTAGFTTDPAGTNQSGGDRLAGNPGVQPERSTTEAVNQTPAASRSQSTPSKLELQAQADSIPVVVADRANIDQTLPFLMDGQREDVHFAEVRLAKPDGYGVLFTNGTGTGKTFLALGIIKRFVKQGKKNGLIVVYNDSIMNEWVKSAPALGLTVSMLENKQDGGTGLVITTFANFGDNSALAKRALDFVIVDEAQYLMQSAEAKNTAALNALKAITLHPQSAYARTSLQNPELVAELAEIRDRLNRMQKRNTDDMMDAQYAEFTKERDNLDKRRNELYAKFQNLEEANRAFIESNQLEKRPRAVFLSATPFAYQKNIQWAEGYLFEYPKVPQSRGYNQPDGYQQFMITHFGYKMKTNKLNEPDAGVDSNVMERQFNSYLRQQGVLSARVLSIDSDYQRQFALTPNAVGTKIAEGLKWLREAEDGRFRDLYGIVNDRFDYLERQRLLEAIKAKEAIPLIKQWHALGKKVVVFFDYNVGGGFSPFDLSKVSDLDINIFGPGGKVVGTMKRKDLIKEFYAKRPDLVAIQTGDLAAPVDALKAAFPSAGIVNGPNKKTRVQSIRDFNDDTKPEANLLLVQSAANAGWSGHDTTGKHPRVLLNLGMPTAPTKAIQQEGRVYRQGQHPSSNSMFTYLNTGTDWERWAFASTISSRASTAENLAMGEMARGLKDAFIQAFEDSETYTPSLDEGKGGKAKDRALVQAISEWDRAKALYYAQGKKTAANKSREGTDYFATPEPLGLKLIQWSGVKTGEDMLEPSAGHGAIARWFPDDTKRTIVEPSFELASRAALVTDAKLVNDEFENLNIINKYDVIAMNPPFGTAGKQASEHLRKAATQHLRDGGRLLAIVPVGSFNEKFDKWFYGVDDKGKPIAPNLHLSARILLPGKTFERAGTGVLTQVLVIDRVDNPEQMAKLPGTQNLDLRGEETITEFFDRLEGLSIRERPKVVAEVKPTDYVAGLLSGRSGQLPSPAVARPAGPGSPAPVTATASPVSQASAGAEDKTYVAPIKGLHSKNGTDIYTVQLKSKLEYADFKAKQDLAKEKYDGYYSYFKGNGAVPGFIFKSAENANAFFAAVTGKTPPAQMQYGVGSVSSPLTAELLRSLQQFLPQAEFANQIGATDFDQAAFDRAALAAGLPNDGNLKGFRVGNKIYLNPATINAQTPMHELGHIWASVMRTANPDVLKRGLSLMAGTRYEAKFKNNPAYARREDETQADYTDRIREEALVEAIADKGLKILNSQTQSKFRQYLTEFWNTLKSLLRKAGMPVQSKSLADASLQEFTDTVARQMVSGTPMNTGVAGQTAGVNPQFISYERLTINPDRKAELEGRYQQATQLASQGVDPDTIWQQTGFFQNPASNGEWSYELDTTQTKLKLDRKELFPLTNPIRARKRKLTLGELLDFPELFTTLPALSAIPVNITNDASSPFVARISDTNSLVEINLAYYGNDTSARILPLDGQTAGGSVSEALSSVLHEVQHAIGNYFSNSKGTSYTREARLYTEDIGRRKAEIRRIREAAAAQKRLEDRQALEEQARELEYQTQQMLKNEEGIIGENYRNNPGEREARAVESRLEIPVTYDPQTGLSLRYPVPARGNDFTSDRVDAQYVMPAQAARPITNRQATTIANFRQQVESKAGKAALKKLSLSDLTKQLQQLYGPVADIVVNQAKGSKTYNTLLKLRKDGPFKANPAPIFDTTTREFNIDLLTDVARLMKGQTPKYPKLSKSLRDILNGQATKDWHEAVGGAEAYIDADGNYIKADAIAETADLGNSLSTIANHKGPWGYLTKLLNTKAAGAITLPETLSSWLSSEAGSALKKLLVDTRRAWVARAAELALSRQQQIDGLNKLFAGISLFDGRNPASQVAKLTYSGYANGKAADVSLPVATWMHMVATHRSQQVSHKGRSSVMADMSVTGHFMPKRYDSNGKAVDYGYDYKDPLTNKTTTYVFEGGVLDKIETELNKDYKTAFDAGKQFFQFGPALDYLKGLYRSVNGEDLVMYSDYFPTVSMNTGNDPLTAMPRLLKNAKILQEREGLPMRVRGGDMLSELQNYARREEHYIGNVATLINLQRWQQRHSSTLTQQAPKWITDYIEELEIDLNDPTARARQQGNWTEINVGGVDIGLRAMLRRFTTSVFSFAPALPLKQVMTMMQGVGLGIVDNKYLAQATLKDLAPLFIQAYHLARQGDEKTLYGTDLAETKYLEEIAKNPYMATVLNRAVGRSEAFLGQPSLDDIKANPVSGTVAATRKVLHTISDFGLGAVRRSDRAVLLSFWKAAQYQVQAEIDAGTLTDENGTVVSSIDEDAAQKKIGNLTERLVFDTNQMTSESDRTPLQRDRSLASTLIGLYSGQQQRLLNTFIQKYADWIHSPNGVQKEEAFKQMIWVGFNNIVLNAALMAVISLLWRVTQKAITGDDREEDYAQTLAWDTTRGILGSFPSIPTEALVMLTTMTDNQKWSSGLIEYAPGEAIGQVINGAQQAVNYLSEEDEVKKVKLLNKLVYNIADGGTKLSGLPNNLSRLFAKMAKQPEKPMSEDEWNALVEQ